jgi:hypothetical protein
MSLRVPIILMFATVAAMGCSDGVQLPDANAKAKQEQRTLPTKTFAGQITIANLPPHYGLNVSLAFFPVDGPDADVPYDGDPPGDAVTDCPELYNNVDLENERDESTRSIPFSINHPAGYYYIQLRTLLYRKQDDNVFAQAEQFFFGRRPLELLDDIPAVTLPVEWPSIPLDELGHYGTVEPQEGQ